MNQHAERRLFFAALPDQASCHALLAAKLRYVNDQRLRWLAQEDWHLTLRFVGNVSPALVEPLTSALKDAAQQHAPTTLTLNQIEPFPSATKPLVLAATGDADVAIQNLVVDLEQRCQTLGLAPLAQTFRAHLSLARIRGRRATPAVVQPLQVVMPITQIDLMESVPSGQGRRYVSIATAVLTG